MRALGSRTRALLLVGAAAVACSGPTPSVVGTDGAPSPSPVASPTASATATGSVPASPDQSGGAPLPPDALVAEAFPVPPGSQPHDVAPAADGGIWYTAQAIGTLGWLDPSSGDTRQVFLGPASAPHGVIVGPDGAAWVTDSGLNAIVRVDPDTGEVREFEVPIDVNVNLNTAVFDPDGILWFTGQAGFYGSVEPASGAVTVHESPGGRGPYGITATPDGDVYYASLAGSHIARIDPASGSATIIEPPTPSQGARRVWSDSRGRIWVSEWEAGQVARYDPAADAWKEWNLPGADPQAYAVYVDERDIVWLTDFGANAIVRFDPETEEFTSLPLGSQPANVRQLLGRPGEVWGAESAADRLVLIRTVGP